LSKLEASLVKIVADIQHAEKEIAEKKADLDADEKQCVDALLRLDIKVDPEARAGRVCEELKDINAKIAETSGIIAAAEEKTKGRNRRQKALRKDKD